MRLGPQVRQANVFSQAYNKGHYIFFLPIRAANTHTLHASATEGLTIRLTLFLATNNSKQFFMQILQFL